MLYGFAVAGSDFMSNRFTPEMLSKIKDDGFDTLLVPLWWGLLESNQAVLQTAKLDGVRDSVDKAKAAGLDIILSFRVCNNPGKIESWWTMWQTGPTHDYVNMTDVGLHRYASFLGKMATMFPDCMICPWHFPYHNQGVDAAKTKRFYGVTVPALVEAVRAHNGLSIVFAPIYQGATRNGETSDYYLSAEPLSDGHVIYGLGHMVPWSVIDGGEWDYNFARMDAAFAGIKRFKEAYGLPMMSVEFAPMSPIKTRSQADCLAASLTRMKASGVGWVYWWISLSQPGLKGNMLVSAPFGLDGAALAELKAAVSWVYYVPPVVEPPVVEPPVVAGSPMWVATECGLEHENIDWLRDWGHRVLSQEIIDWYHVDGEDFAEFVRVHPETRELIRGKLLELIILLRR